MKQPKFIREEEVLVQAGLHSRRRAMAELGVEDPEAKFGRWLAEEKRLQAEFPKPTTTRM